MPEWDPTQGDVTWAEVGGKLVATLRAGGAFDALDDVTIHSAGADWIRFGDGTQICTVTRAFGGITTAFGAGYISAAVTAAAWPQAFIAPPTVAGWAVKSAGNAPAWIGSGTGGATAANTPTFWVNAWLSSADGGTVTLLAIGKWK